MKNIALVSFVVLPFLAGCGAQDPLDVDATDEAALALSTTATLRLDNNLNGSTDHINERCDVDLTWLNNQLGTSITAGRQLRIGRSGVAGALGVCTVQNRASASNIVRMGNLGFARIDSNPPADETTDTSIFLETVVPSTSYTISTASTAKTDQEYFEDTKDTNTSNNNVVALAPHGGSIELRTDTQANSGFYSNMPSSDVTSWQANGYNNTSSDSFNAFDHWHITATDINEAAYPKLNQIIGRSFRYAVAFHGYNSTRNGASFYPNKVMVGGAEVEFFRREVAEMINWGARNDDLTQVITANYNNLPSDLAGTASDNIVNRITAVGRGLQLEQSTEARGVVSGSTDYSPRIAKAVAGVFRCMIDTQAATVDASQVTTSQDSAGSGYGSTVCARRIVNVTVPAGQTSTFRLSAFVPLTGLTQAQCSAFEGYVSIYKRESDRFERKQGGIITASWNGSSCDATASYTYDVTAPATGTDTYRITVSGRYGTSLSAMTTISATARVERLP